MVSASKSTESGRPRRPPAKTPEESERRLIGLAVEQAEYLLSRKEAPGPVLVHYLKMASTREQLELEKLRRENKLLEAREASLVSAARVEELIGEALQAMKSYTGQATVDEA